MVKNDKEIQRCFLAAGNHYGLIVTGYSGRDSNIMEMLNMVLDQNNPFPHGIFWTTTSLSKLPQSVIDFITKARAKNINAYIVEIETFDSLLSKIWRQVENKPEFLDAKVRTATLQKVSIELPLPSKNGYPILRTNALSITQAPNKCAAANTAQTIGFQELRDAAKNYSKDLLTIKTDKILAWGSKKSLSAALGAFSPTEPTIHEIDDPIQTIKESTIMKSFFEEALIHGLVHEKPLLIRKRGHRFYIVVDHTKTSEAVFKPLKKATGYQNRLGTISGSFQEGVFFFRSCMR